jgi:hypothetical protein
MGADEMKETRCSTSQSLQALHKSVILAVFKTKQLVVQMSQLSHSAMVALRSRVRISALRRPPSRMKPCYFFLKFLPVNVEISLQKVICQRHSRLCCVCHLRSSKSSLHSHVISVCRKAAASTQQVCLFEPQYYHAYKKMRVAIFILFHFKGS